MITLVEPQPTSAVDIWNLFRDTDLYDVGQVEVLELHLKAYYDSMVGEV